jgi:hypothetical protein
MRQCGTWAKHAGVPLPRFRAVAGAGRLFSTPSRPALRAACGRPPARQLNAVTRGTRPPDQGKLSSRQHTDGPHLGVLRHSCGHHRRRPTGLGMQRDEAGRSGSAPAPASQRPWRIRHSVIERAPPLERPQRDAPRSRTERRKFRFRSVRSYVELRRVCRLRPVETYRAATAARAKRQRGGCACLDGFLLFCCQR